MKKGDDVVTRRKVGRPDHEPTDQSRKKVAHYAAIGIAEDDIAKIVGVSPKTLRKHYREELDLAFIKANAAVVGNLHRIATGNSRQAAAAAIFWTKVRMGWRETQNHAVMGPSGGPVEHKFTIEFVGATDESQDPEGVPGSIQTGEV